MKRIGLFFLVLVVCWSMSGCSKGRQEHFTKEEAQKYLETAYGEKFEFIKQETNEEENIVSFIFNTPKHDSLSIQVDSRRNEGGLFGCLGDGCQYVLRDNYEDIAYDYYGDLIAKEMDEERVKKYQDINRNAIEIYYYGYLDLDQSYEVVQKVWNRLNEVMPRNMKYPIKWVYSDEGMKQCAPLETFNKLSNQDLSEMKEEFIRFVTDYDLQEEGVDKQYSEVLYHISNGERFIILDGLSENSTYADIYKIAKAWGYDVQGTIEDFIVTTNENNYHFSYDFYHVTDNDVILTYYLKNDGEVENYDYRVTKKIKLDELRVKNLNREISLIDFDSQVEFDMPVKLVDNRYVLNVEGNGFNQTTRQLIQSLSTVGKAERFGCNRNLDCTDDEKAYDQMLDKMDEIDQGGYQFIVGDQVRMVNEDYRDMKNGFYYYEFDQKVFLPDYKDYYAIENIEEIFNVKASYDEVNNAIILE